MSRISYVNGAYVDHRHAMVHVNDRGYQFADGVYEVVACMNGDLTDEKGHLDRLERSLAELRIEMPVKRSALSFIMRELLKRNRYKNAAVYIQITRGVAKRDFKFPHNIKPSLVMSCWACKYDDNPAIQNGVKAVTVTDQRWARRDIKTIALLPQALAKQKAADNDAYEAIMLNGNGEITEGSSSNFWIYKNGILKTTPKSHEILKGVTRTAIFSLAKQENIKVIEEHFLPNEAYEADEAFLSSATGFLVPVIEIDKQKIGNGKPGAFAKEFFDHYKQYAKKGYDAQIPWRY